MSAVTDGLVFHGYCHVNQTNNLLDGSCFAPFLGTGTCRSKGDPQQCPKGAKAIRTGWVSFGANCRAIWVDAARQCAFTY